MSVTSVSDYLIAHSTPADDLLTELAEETAKATGDSAGMQISQDEGALLALLVKISGARNALEVGVFTGYSSLSVARALPEDGRLLACDVSDEWTSIARRYWQRAGVEHKIELRIGPAADTLKALPDEPRYDFAFIDADKVSYPVYYEEVVRRTVPGGLILLDNVFMAGKVFDSAEDAAPVAAIRQTNDRIAADERVESVMLPVRDGVTVVRKR